MLRSRRNTRKSEGGRAIAGGAKAVAVTQCLYGGADLDIYAVGTDARKAGISDGGYMTTEYAVAWMMREVGMSPD